jgi:nucleotide-binding universal stress UspA family protein
MYRKILVALDHTEADTALLPHISKLAELCAASLVLVHVADGWVARNFERLNLSESDEMRDDREYLEKTAADLRAKGIATEIRLALGDPPSEILKLATDEGCDLIGMTTHGHRLIGDIIYGSTIEQVRHAAQMPVLLVRAEKR